MTKQMKALALVAILALVALSAACGGGGGNPVGPGPVVVTSTPTPVSNSPVVVRFEVRTSCGGTRNGAPVASDVVNPPYILPFRNEYYCLRVLQSGVATGCSLGGSVTTDQGVVMFNGSNSWPLNGTATYTPVVNGELPRGGNEQSLVDFGLALNPGTYPFTAKLTWSCTGSSGEAQAFTQIVMSNAS